ncbi:MAG TPA: FAD-dependent oxidoreductase [Acidisarcina sp.]
MKARYNRLKHTPYNRRVDTDYVVVDADSDVIVAGAGIIGLSTALELADAGLRVTVVERASCMRDASWAAAGMLAAGDPENPLALKELADLSLSLYPAYLRRVEELSGRDVPFRTSITLQATRLGERFDPFHLIGRKISSLQALQVVPHLATVGREFSFLEEASLDPRDLCAALPTAAKAAGVRVIEDTTVIAVASLPGRGVEVRTSRGKFLTNNFVNCAGAWASDIARLAPNSFRQKGSHGDSAESLPISPRKGQMVAVRVDDGAALACVLRAPEIYLVPRGDGRILIGATVEDAGFDKLVEPAKVHALLASAAALWPPIASATILESWAGLRPWSPDGLPIIGPGDCVSEDSASDNSGFTSPSQWVATGHFRNGILLAPATARLICQLVRGVATEIDVAPFSGDRFAPILL